MAMTGWAGSQRPSNPTPRPRRGGPHAARRDRNLAPEARQEIYPRRDAGIVDQRVPVSLSLEDGLVAVVLPARRWKARMPLQQSPEALARQLALGIADLPWIPQEKIESRPRNRPLPVL